MSHTNQPEYFTINSICPHDGSVICLGIFEDMDAVAWRLKRCYTSCGDEYRIHCYHLSTASDEAKEYNEQQINRVKYKKENAIKDKLYNEFQEKNNESNSELEVSQEKV